MIIFFLFNINLFKYDAKKSSHILWLFDLFIFIFEIENVFILNQRYFFIGL